MSRNTKTLIIIGLCVSILGLTVGYAALSSVLNITGTAKTGTLATNWNIKFKNASCEKTGYAIAGNITTEGTSLTLSDSVLVSPSDEVICTFDVVNEGTIDAEVTSVTVPNINNFTYVGSGTNKENDESIVQNGIISEMKYNNETKDEIQIGDSLNVGESKSVYIKISYKEEMMSLPENDVAINDIYAEIIYGQKGSSSESGGETTNEYAIGTPYQIDPGDGVERTFYVLEDNGDSVSLIMNENLGDTVARITQEDYKAAGGTQWSSNTDKNSFGPITANNYLESQTSSWTVDASLPTYDQIYNVNNSTTLTNTPWLYENLQSSSDGGPVGYWTSTPYSSYSNMARSVNYVNGLIGRSVSDTTDGVRPVITVSKDQLS